MDDTPSRDEFAARLEAAEARTETRIAQLGITIEARGAALDRNINAVASEVHTLASEVHSLASDVRGLFGAVGELKTDYKDTRRVIWTTATGSVIAIAGLVVALWIASINIQANMISIFQAAITVRSLPQAAEPPKARQMIPTPAPLLPEQPKKS